MKSKFVIVCFLLVIIYFGGKGQVKDTSFSKPELFNSGFIDIMNSGQVNASARFIKLYIGEPEKFSIPFSFYGGISNNSFQSSSPSKSNELLVNQYINPMSGLGCSPKLDKTSCYPCSYKGKCTKTITNISMLE